MMTSSTWSRRLGYVAFLTVASLTLCELTLRPLYREPWYQQLVMEQAGEISPIQYTRNRLGLRDRDYPADKPAAVRRVLFLGDSFTYGSGVPDDRAVFPKRVEELLADSRYSPGVDRVEVLNGGIPGSYPAHWLDLL